MWWWSNYGPTGWMFFGPMMMLVFMAVLMAGMFFVMRAMHRHRSEVVGTSSTDMCGVAISPSHDHSAPWRDEPPDDGHSAFERDSAETLQRLDEEQRQFQEFFVQLRMAKNKGEFDQFGRTSKSDQFFGES